MLGLATLSGQNWVKTAIQWIFTESKTMRILLIVMGISPGTAGNYICWSVRLTPCSSWLQWHGQKSCEHWLPGLRRHLLITWRELVHVVSYWPAYVTDRRRREEIVKTSLTCVPGRERIWNWLKSALQRSSLSVGGPGTHMICYGFRHFPWDVCPSDILPSYLNVKIWAQIHRYCL